MTNTKTVALSEALARYAARAIELGATDETQVALDAASTLKAGAHELLVGVPVTWSIGSDRYADKIASVTPSLLTIKLESGKTFRFTGKYYTQGKSYFLSLLGVGRDYRDPSF